MKKVNSSQQAKSKVRMMFLGWQWNQIEGGDAITSHTAKNSRNNVFSSKQFTNKRHRLTYSDVSKKEKEYD